MGYLGRSRSEGHEIEQELPGVTEESWRVSVQWVQGLGHEEALGMVAVTVLQQCECIRCHRSVRLKMVKTLWLTLCVFYHILPTYETMKLGVGMSCFRVVREGFSRRGC